MASPSTLWTIGHSTRPIEEFLTLLTAHRIRRLMDVRTIPRSRHNPQFNSESLAGSLREAKLDYRHVAALGGLRKARKDSSNTGWRNASFRGYADYMQTDEFWSALEDLMASSESRNTVVMCAEAVPWRCHRSMIADALLIRGWNVRHILSEKKADMHHLTSFARVENGRLLYPASLDAKESTPRLF